MIGNYDVVVGNCVESMGCCDLRLMRYAYAIVVVDWLFIGIAAITILATGCLLSLTRAKQ